MKKIIALVIIFTLLLVPLQVFAAYFTAGEDIFGNYDLLGEATYSLNKVADHQYWADVSTEGTGYHYEELDYIEVYAGFNETYDGVYRGDYKHVTYDSYVSYYYTTATTDGNRASCYTRHIIYFRNGAESDAEKHEGTMLYY